MDEINQKIKSAAIVLNGDIDNIEIKENFIICTDAAIKSLKSKKCDVLIGDMDSLGDYSQYDCKKILCPVEKDYTDGEKAIRYASEIGIENISIYNYRGGRTDHFYSNLSLLKIAKELKVNCKLVSSIEEIMYFEEKEIVSLEVPIKTTISIIPYLDYVVINNSKGLYYPLNNLKIPRDSTIGNSNYAINNHISFEIAEKSAFVFINRQY